jgi:chorismate synthase
MLRFLTAGESHGPGLTAILEGMPAGLPIKTSDLNVDLARRQRSYGAGGRMNIEKDQARLQGGILGGRTTGAPIAVSVENRDWKNWNDKDIDPMTIPRPGHADLTATIKYSYGDLRLALERASARETAARVAIGAICRRLLTEFGVVVGSYVVSIGSVSAQLPLPEGSDVSQVYLKRFADAEQNDVRCPDTAATQRMMDAISNAMRAKDTIGGIFEVVALNTPPGLGSHVHWDRRLDARLMAAVGGIQAIKGVEIGPAFENTRLPGTHIHDPIFIERTQDGNRDIITRRTNRAGGLEGGITTGQPVVVRGAMKPISTTLNPLPSVDLASGQPATTRYERSDFCAVPRAAVVAEAMVAFVLADALIERLGGDCLKDMHARFANLPVGYLDELTMDNIPWRLMPEDEEDQSLHG